jgi:hypothetical protein
MLLLFYPKNAMYFLLTHAAVNPPVNIAGGEVNPPPFCG